jgi:hypothetical protein
LFEEMRAAGLYFGYMGLKSGLESGLESGLKTLNRQITVEQNLRAVEILKNLDIAYQFGFMLFEPSSTFASVEENLNFLHAIVDDGSVAVTFCRMIPYDGTPIKDELLRTGRLKGDICHPATPSQKLWTSAAGSMVTPPLSPQRNVAVGEAVTPPAPSPKIVPTTGAKGCWIANVSASCASYWTSETATCCAP